MTIGSDTYWWDGRNPDSFFPAIYRMGDDSIEGNLDGQCMDLDQRTTRECDMIESILELPAGTKILDCPCGYGRHSIELARRGYNMTGIDLCPQFIAEAREKIYNASVDLCCRFIQGDMRAIPVSAAYFDVCLNMFLSFGFFDDADNLRVLREFCRVLRPGGKLLIHTDVNPQRIELGCYGDRAVRKLHHGGQVQVEEFFDKNTKTLHGTWTVEQSNIRQTISRSYTIKVYSHDEMKRLLEIAGFSDVVIVFPASPLEAIDKVPQEVVYVGTR